MVTAVTTSTSSLATQAFNGRHLDRNQDGTLWTAYYDATAVVSRLAYSKDNGATWTAGQTMVPTNSGGLPIGGLSPSLFIDQDDYAHFAWKQVSGTTNLTANYVYYMRGTPNAGRTAWTWSTAILLTGSTPGYDVPDVLAHREGSGWTAHVVMSFLNGSVNFAAYQRVNISGAGTPTSAGLNGSGLNDTLALGGNYAVAAATYPSIDFNHTGDGKTVAGGTPHLYVGWTAGATGAGKGVRFRKAVYSGGSWTWNAEREIDTLVGASDVAAWLLCQFDGTRVALAGDMARGGGTFDLIAHERDAADTTTVLRRLLSSATTTDYLFYGSGTYDQAGNLYLFGRDGTGVNGTRKLNWRKWTRSTATLGAITSLDTTGNDAPYISAKRGYAPGGSIEVVYTDGTVSPYTVQYDRTVVLNTAPGAPLLVAPANASSRDLAAGFPFDWEPQDPDAGDSQTAYAFRRKVAGAATYEYWNASLSAFQSTEVFNISPASDLTFGPGKWTNGQTYNWSVRTRDAGNPALDGPYATDSTVTASTAPVVTVTAPSGTITNTSRPLVTWTYSDAEGSPQQTYQVRILTQAVYGAAGFDPVLGPGTAPAVADSGVLLDAAARSYSVTTDLDNLGTYRAYVQSGQAGDQRSAWSFSAFTLNLVPPNPPTLTATVEPALARVRLNLTSTDLGPDFTPANSVFMVEASTDGLTWRTVRDAAAVPIAPDKTGVAYDREARLGQPTTYRARTVSST